MLQSLGGAGTLSCGARRVKAPSGRLVQHHQQRAPKSRPLLVADVLLGRQCWPGSGMYSALRASHAPGSRGASRAAAARLTDDDIPGCNLVVLSRTRGQPIATPPVSPVRSCVLAAEGRCAWLDSSPTQSHTAREQGPVTLHYPWHPRCGQRLSVRWAQRHGGVTHYHCVSPDGAFVPVPAWMTDAVHCARLSLANSPRASMEALGELGKLLRAVLSRWHQEGVPLDETTETTVSVRKRSTVLERAGDILAGDAVSADSAAAAGSSSARRDGEE